MPRSIAAKVSVSTSTSFVAGIWFGWDCNGGWEGRELSLDKIEKKYNKAVIINLSPEKEAELRAHVRAQGLSVEEWLITLISESPVEKPSSISTKFANLSDLLLHSPLAGANLNLDRTQDYPRPVDIE